MNKKNIGLVILIVLLCLAGYFAYYITFYEFAEPLSRASLSTNVEAGRYPYFSYENDEITLTDFDESTRIYALTIEGQVQLADRQIQGFTEDYLGSFIALSTPLLGDVNEDGIQETVYPAAKTDMEYTQNYVTTANAFLTDKMPFEPVFANKENFVMYYKGEVLNNAQVEVIPTYGERRTLTTDDIGTLPELSYLDASDGVLFMYSPDEQSTYVSSYIVESNSLFSARYFSAITPFLIILGLSILCIILCLFLRKSLYKSDGMQPGKTKIFSLYGKKGKLRFNFMSVRWVVMIGSFLLIIFGARLIGSQMQSVYLPTFACPYNTEQLVNSHCYYFANLELLGELSIGNLLLFFGSFLACVLLLGRVFCGFVCPVGLLQDIAHEARQALHIEGISLNERLYAILRFIKWIVLILFVGLSFVGGNFCDFCPAIALSPALGGVKLTLFFSGFFMVAVLVSAFFKRRTFCNICPLGYIIGLFHRISLFKLKKDCVACTECGACYEACPMGIKSIYTERKHSNVTTADCIMCGECIKKCPEDEAISITWCGKKVYTSDRSNFVRDYAEGDHE